MDQSYIILLIILALGLFIKNDSLAIAGSLLILLRLLKLDIFFPKLEANGLKVGIIILTIGILTPIAAGKYTLNDVMASMKTPLGISSILAGAFVIMFTRRGYELLTSDPGVVIPIVFGSIIGLVVFKGIPVGPLVSSGVALVLFNIYKLIEKFWR